MKRPWFLATLGLCAIYVAVLVINAPGVGFTRDEGYYFKAAAEYGAWWDTLFSSRFFEAFGDAEIKLRFGYNTEHPALVKLSQGITYRVFHEWLGLTSPSTGYRFTGFLFGALTLIATFLLGRELASARVGFVAALLMATLPRFFFDAHLACFDVPMTAVWTLSLWTFWRAYQSPQDKLRKRILLAALVFGLAMATKLNALFLPFVFVAVWIWTGDFLGAFALRTGPSGSRDVVLPSIPWVLIACALLGPLVFLAHWPYLWHDTLARINAYLAFHLHHEHYPISYFHAVLAKPPFPISFPFVMTAVTVPSPMLALGGLGFVVSAWRALKRSPADTLLVVALLIPMIAIALPNTPIFGGTKHWYNAMPALAILAARVAVAGADALARRLPERARPWATVVAAIWIALPGALGIAASPTAGIGFYNELAGGFRGGAALGMQRGFWGGLARPDIGRLKDLPRSSRVFFNRTNYDAFRMYQREGTVPNSVYYGNDTKGSAAALHFEQPEHGEKEGEIWSDLGPRPIGGVYVDNVTMTQIYRRGRSSAPP